MKQVNTEEVKATVFSMHPEKAACVDGFSLGFYQKYLEILGSAVTEACIMCNGKMRLPEGLNDAMLVLLPNKKDPDKLTELHPISLCNMAYKVKAKFMANRLKYVLSDVISENQNAFVQGRFIMDSLVVAYEVSFYLKG